VFEFWGRHNIRGKRKKGRVRWGGLTQEWGRDDNEGGGER
jgi:hypothetical protein